ncbi:DUF4365 domain-containing protein [Paenibacillus sp. B2(2019)]|uniref:DUF4365 domain-containing protein n=1 Tax=Paenibacillus sp. B2(2019) TaxID=2607754 RepID=UPI0011F0A6FC|nr:DUF4365 domain-containing protein [Paenibacillus sp. B2(2019)]KAA1179705.1 DUF4365 domain-containing protein [Paenibacillus sp. B2(2019)]
MLTDEHIKEGLSLAYVSAVAHMAGMDYTQPKFDYGIDGTISEIKVRPDGRRCPNGFKVEFQLKSTVNLSMDSKYITYNLDSKNYNDLVETEIGTPRILIVFYLPRDRNHWLNLSESELVLKHCAWWTCLYGNTPTRNVSKKTVQIPRDQLFDVSALQKIIRDIRGGRFYASL